MTSSLMVLAAGAGEHGGWWPLWLLFWAAVITTVVWLVTRWRRRPNGDERARDILAERFARGELSADEYRERLAAL